MSVFLTISESKLQNFKVLESSKGASTSSKIQIGLGFALKTAKISDNAVSVCSPPESKEIVESFFPGGWQKISNPASRGSELSTKVSVASPPPNNSLKSHLKFLFTSSNALFSLSLPSLFKSEMPEESFSNAFDKSSFSAFKLEN